MADKRDKDDGRFSDPVPIVRYDKDGNLVSGTPEQAARIERIREAMNALDRGDEETYRKLIRS
ncbi:MAG: hypothetical protein F4W90_10185 [Gammaproteobacteria bacterium]|nr:hypothetical protein [Gammaproteobacteria bacterium]